VLEYRRRHRAARRVPRVKDAGLEIIDDGHSQFERQRVDVADARHGVVLPSQMNYVG
jgi:hypothetical protein